MPKLSKAVSFTFVAAMLLCTTGCQSKSQTITQSNVRKTMPSGYEYSAVKVTETRTVNGNDTQNYASHSNHYTSFGHDHNHNHGHSHSHEYWDTTNVPDYESWLKDHEYYGYQIKEYQGFLTKQLGANNVPPMNQLLRTARSWQKCGAQPYEIPPRYLWTNMVPTLKLYTTLKQQGVLPSNTIIRSVYRNYGLNRCAGGASSSKHLENSAIDIYVPGSENDSWMVDDLQEKLCQFWLYQGASHNFGLGLYATEAIHLDTGSYRKWGTHHTPSYSTCRY